MTGLFLIASIDSHCRGGKERVTPDAVALLCRWPQDTQIAPTPRMSVSFDISFSRTPIKPAMTGPAHLSHEYAERCRYCFFIGSSKSRATALHRTAAAYQVNDQHH